MSEKLYRCKKMKNLLKLFLNIHTCLYDKAKKEYKDKIVTGNVWKEVSDQLIFIENGKLKKLRHLSLTAVEILLWLWEI